MKLSEVRAKRLLSSRALAQQAGISPKSVYSIEKGEWLSSLATVAKLAKILEVEPTEVDEFRAAIQKSAAR